MLKYNNGCRRFPTNTYAHRIQNLNHDLNVQNVRFKKCSLISGDKLKSKIISLNILDVESE
ncbi:hypothetical protein BLOT_000160 [Blomia tropicalis]|nr:hypothetical protein BLOT_000160 [Blomia tropicalis]